MSTNIAQKNIPSGWQDHVLSDLCDSLDNRRIPITKSDRISGDVPYYGATGIIDYVHGQTFDEEILLIGEDGADWSPYANKAFIVRGRSWVNNHAHVLKCKDISTHEYLEQYLNWKNLDVYTTGGTRKKLNKEVLMSIPVCLPVSKLEQQKIAEILGTVDEDIAKTQEVIKATEKLKRGLMQQLFTHGLRGTAFDIVPLGKAAKVQGGYSFKSSDFSDSGVPVIRISNIKDGYIKLDDVKYYPKEVTTRIAGFSLKKDDVVIAMSGATTGKIGIVKAIDLPLLMNQRVGRFVPSTDIDGKYLYNIVISEFYQKRIWDFAIGGAQPNVSGPQLESIEIPLPEISVQREIADILSAVDEKIAVNKKSKVKLTLLKKGLMQDLLSGTVRTNI